jgi:hypothetical protein
MILGRQMVEALEFDDFNLWCCFCDNKLVSNIVLAMLIPLCSTYDHM